MTRGLFRLWLVASLIWVVMLLPGLWGGTKSPFPAFTLADNIWFETTHHTFDNASYVYTRDGKTKPEGTKAKKSGPGTTDDLAWGDEQYDHEIATDQTIKLHKISPDEAISDATYTDLTFPQNLNLWVPLDLATAERQKVLDTFDTRYVVPREWDVWKSRLWMLGLIFIPPAGVFLLGAALVLAFSGFRERAP
jgi:hypothetical protein